MNVVNLPFRTELKLRYRHGNKEVTKTALNIVERGNGRSGTVIDGVTVWDVQVVISIANKPVIATICKRTSGLVLYTARETWDVVSIDGRDPKFYQS